MTIEATANTVTWTHGEVSSPRLSSVPVIAAKGIPYLPEANHLQRLNIYLPVTESNGNLDGSLANGLPDAGSASGAPQTLVHVRGGAWRDPQLTATSIEAAVAHAFADDNGPITAIASIDYTISPFPTHPNFPYDPDEDGHDDPAREAIHPQHVSDVLHGLALLRTFGVADDSYLLSGHSCGACIAAQAVLGSPQQLGLQIDPAPRPAGFLGLNGLYDLPALVDGLGPSHERMRGDYTMLLSTAFGPDAGQWASASPALFAVDDITARVQAGTAPRLVLLEQSPGDQLVPMNQKERLADQLSRVSGLRVVDGHRCTGRHAAPWQRGDIIWQSVQDVLQILEGH